jgi:uncharacterized membrane protein
MTTATEPTRRYRTRVGESGFESYSGSEQPNRRAADVRGHRDQESIERRARALGWFSIGLGLAQIGAPRAVARMIGVNDDDETRNTMFAIGLREITSGIGILTRPRPTGWVWSRVGGDVMDLALLGKALNSEESDRTRVAAATAAVLGVGVVDFLTGQQLRRGGNGAAEARGGSPRERRRGSSGIEVTQAITTNRPRHEVYGFWRNFENLPRFMEHLESVRVLDERRSRWKAKAPVGSVVEWEAEIVEDRPEELIAWRSLPESQVPNSGVVRFRDAPGDRGTEIIVELKYQPPGGRIGALFAKLFGEEPNQQVKSDLRRFKQVMEIGEVLHSDASIHRGPHPAQPPEDLRETEIKSPELASARQER